MFIGIDWGGTKMEVIALDRDGTTRARHRIATPTSGYDACIRAVQELVATAEQMAGEQGTIGIGIPGSPNPRTGIVRNSNAEAFGFYRHLGYLQDDSVSLGKRLIADA